MVYKAAIALALAALSLQSACLAETDLEEAQDDAIDDARKGTDDDKAIDPAFCGMPGWPCCNAEQLAAAGTDDECFETTDAVCCMEDGVGVCYESECAPFEEDDDEDDEEDDEYDPEEARDDAIEDARKGTDDNKAIDPAFCGMPGWPCCNAEQLAAASTTDECFETVDAVCCMEEGLGICHEGACPGDAGGAYGGYGGAYGYGI